MPSLVRFDFRTLGTEQGFYRLRQLLAVGLVEQELTTAKARLLLKIAEDLRDSLPRPESPRFAHLLAEAVQQRTDDAVPAIDEAEP